MSSIQLCWFRRDLRLHDHAALFHALTQRKSVQPIFIFDSDILSELKADDKRVTFIYLQLQKMKEICQQHGSDLKIYYGKSQEVFAKIFSSNHVSAVYTNHDYEPYAIQRDQTIEALCKQHSIQFLSYKDQVIFEKNEVIKEDGTPYTVYTPYSKKWKLKLQQEGLPSFPSEKLLHHLNQCQSELMISLDEIGFELQHNDFSSMIPDLHIIAHYQETRDYPGIEGTSRLGIHLRFGTISIRQLTELAMKANEKFLNELIWREFYQAIIWHFPQVVHRCFKPKYEDIQWRNDEAEFEAWCNGLTGYPLVDAGMRQLNQTGWMHNRVRMVVASFLSKHLLIDWRWGEAYFATKLLDFDLASNNGGWQWAAGCGVDAAPYFRVFNPTLQTEKFDPHLKYIQTWIPELNTFNYPKPMVEHSFARKRCLEVYKKALGS